MNFRSVIVRSVTSVLLISAVVFATGGPKSPPLHTVWTVTVDATGSGHSLTYALSSNPSGAPNCSGLNPHPSPSASYLYICPGDTVQWVAKTKTNQSGEMKSELGLLHEECILLDKWGHSHQSFHASHGHPTEGGATDDPCVALKVPHKYYAVVFDKVSNQWHYDDPKIIVGGGSPVPDPGGSEKQ